MKLPLPINGLYTKPASESMPVSYTEYSNNVRSIDTQGDRVRIGQRPGLVKVNVNQLGSMGQPIVAMAAVAVVDNTEG